MWTWLDCGGAVFDRDAAQARSQLNPPAKACKGVRLHPGNARMAAYPGDTDQSVFVALRRSDATI